MVIDLSALATIVEYLIIYIFYSNNMFFITGPLLNL